MHIKKVYEVWSTDGHSATFHHHDHELVMMLHTMVSHVPILNSNRKVPLIKMVRSILDIDLITAKYFVEDAWRASATFNTE